MKQKMLTALAGVFASTALLLPAGMSLARAQSDQLSPATARIAVQKPGASEPQYQRGSIVSLYLSSQGSDNFAKYRGILTLDFVGTGAMEYTWGGSTCPGRDVSPENVQIIVMARAHGLKITPETKPGQGGALCLTGFTLSG